MGMPPCWSKGEGAEPQAGRAAARGAQSVALIPPCPASSQIPFTSMSACSVRPEPGETAHGAGGEDLLKRHRF